MRCQKCWADTTIVWVATDPIDALMCWDKPPSLEKQPIWIRHDHYASVIRACPAHGEFSFVQRLECEYQLQLVDTNEIYWFEPELWLVDANGRRVPFPDPRGAP